MSDKQERKKPEREYSHGDMSITVWRVKRRAYIDGFNVHIYDGHRACIDRGDWDLKTGRWRSQQIWMNYEELDCLKKVLEEKSSAGLLKSKRAENTNCSDGDKNPELKGKRRGKLERKYIHGNIALTVWRAKRCTYFVDYSALRYNGHRVRIQHSIWDHKTGKWRRQQIWMNYEELDCLNILMRQLYADLDKKPYVDNHDRIHEPVDKVAAWD